MLHYNDLNGVKCTLSANILSTDTLSIAMTSAGSPFKLPPAPDFLSPDLYRHYFLTIKDATTPSKWERVKVKARAGSDPNFTYTLERNIDSSDGSAHDFDAGSIVEWIVGSEEIGKNSMIDLSACGAMTVNSGDVKYVCPKNPIIDATETNRQWVSGFPGDLQFDRIALYVSAESLAGGDPADVIIKINGSAATGAIIPAYTTGMIVEAPFDPVTISPADKVSYEIDASSATSGSVTFGMIALEAWVKG